MRSFSETGLASFATPAEAVRTHWREYLMEAAELGALMFSICLFGSMLYSAGSPLHTVALSVKALLMGIAVAATTFLIIRSPFGRRSGAHFNPAITLTYWWLGRIQGRDAAFYVVGQFAGAVAGVLLAREVLGLRLSAVPVRYVVTTPGNYGTLTAFAAEFFLAAVLMGVVLFATNHRKLARFSPLLVASVTVFYYAGCASISGFSVNPARTFSSALFAWVWHGIWIYFAAPSLGMLTAAFIYIRSMGPGSVYCAKIFHDLETPCPFPCRFDRLQREITSHPAEPAQQQ